jgi:acetylornithine deacetylase/succinyl-diaminopimelate desuccinylase-like protein
MMDTDFLARLVELDTNSESKSNYSQCVELIKKRAEKAGFGVELYYAQACRGKPRPNLIISLDAGAEQTLLLATHYDVVLAGDGWRHNPFNLTIEGGKAYGRGAADDKGGIFSAFSALKTLKERGSSKVNVKLLVTCDEEVGGEQGLGFLMRKKSNGRFIVDGDAAIIIDAGPHVYIGSSGRASGKVSARGSLQELLSLLSSIIDYSKERANIISKLTSASAKRRIWGRISVTMLDISAGMVEYAKAGVKSNIIPGECRIKIRGKDEVVILGRQGHAGYPHLAENAIDKSLPLLKKAAGLSDGQGKCELVFDLRTIPEESLESALTEFEKYMSKTHPKAELEVSEKAEGYALPETHPLVGMLKHAAGERKVYGMLGGTDVQFFSRRQIPSVCFGPIADNSNIHGKDEFVKIKDLEFVSKTLVKLCENWRPQNFSL